MSALDDVVQLLAELREQIEESARQSVAYRQGRITQVTRNSSGVATFWTVSIAGSGDLYGVPALTSCLPTLAVGPCAVSAVRGLGSTQYLIHGNTTTPGNS